MAFGESGYLSLDPRSFGEPLYHLPALNMQVRTCVVRPFVVHYAVLRERPIVVLKGVDLLSFNP